MSLLKDVTDILKDVAEGIKHIKTIADTVRSGKEYLKHKHPEVRTDLSALCGELRNTSSAVAAASAVLTHFRFTVSGPARDTEPARFNDHLIAHKAKAAEVGRSLEAVRGHCRKIRAHAGRLQEQRKAMGLDRLLQLFGIESTGRDRTFSRALQAIYDEETQSYRLIDRLSQALQLSLNDIASALGPAGTMRPENVPAASTLLGEYAKAFGALESESKYLAQDLQESIDELDN
jgi:hypothetical protein